MAPSLGLPRGALFAFCVSFLGLAAGMITLASVGIVWWSLNGGGGRVVWFGLAWALPLGIMVAFLTVWAIFRSQTVLSIAVTSEGVGLLPGTRRARFYRWDQVRPPVVVGLGGWLGMTYLCFSDGERIVRSVELTKEQLREVLLHPARPSWTVDAGILRAIGAAE